MYRMATIWAIKTNTYMFVCCPEPVGRKIHIGLKKHRLSLERNTRTLLGLTLQEDELGNWGTGTLYIHLYLSNVVLCTRSTYQKHFLVDTN